VVDGQLERVGSDVEAVQRAVKQAAQSSKALVDVVTVRASDRDVRVNMHVTVPASLTLRENADVVIAITEDNLATEVRRGENLGRTLRHSAVVRSLTAIGTLSRANVNGRMAYRSSWRRIGLRRTFESSASCRNAQAAGSSAPVPRAVGLT
jgi:hypothetical protein